MSALSLVLALIMLTQVRAQTRSHTVVHCNLMFSRGLVPVQTVL